MGRTDLPVCEIRSAMGASLQLLPPKDAEFANATP